MKSKEILERVRHARGRASNYLIVNQYRLHLTMMDLSDEVVEKIMSMLRETFEAGYVTQTQGLEFKEPVHGISLDTHKSKIDDYFDNTHPEQINKEWGLVKDDVYEITEINEHEGETFGYIIKLTDEQVGIIKEYFDAHNKEWGYEVKSIKEFELTSEEVDLINRYNSGTYSKRLKYMRLSEQFKPDASVLRDMDFAYKGSGMVEEKYT